MKLKMCFQKKQKGKWKTLLTKNPESDIDYDSESGIDNHSETDDESDDALLGQFTSVFSVYLKHVLHCTDLIYYVTCFLINKMVVDLGKYKRWF